MRLKANSLLTAYMKATRKPYPSISVTQFCPVSVTSRTNFVWVTILIITSTRASQFILGIANLHGQKKRVRKRITSQKMRKKRIGWYRPPKLAPLPCIRRYRWLYMVLHWNATLFKITDCASELVQIQVFGCLEFILAKLWQFLSNLTKVMMWPPCWLNRAVNQHGGQ